MVMSLLSDSFYRSTQPSLPAYLAAPAFLHGCAEFISLLSPPANSDLVDRRAGMPPPQFDSHTKI